MATKSSSGNFYKSPLFFAEVPESAEKRAFFLNKDLLRAYRVKTEAKKGKSF